MGVNGAAQNLTLTAIKVNKDCHLIPDESAPDQVRVTGAGFHILPQEATEFVNSTIKDLLEIQINSVDDAIRMAEAYRALVDASRHSDISDEEIEAKLGCSPKEIEESQDCLASLKANAESGKEDDGSGGEYVYKESDLLRVVQESIALPSPEEDCLKCRPDLEESIATAEELEKRNEEAFWEDFFTLIDLSVWKGLDEMLSCLSKDADLSQYLIPPCYWEDQVISANLYYTGSDKPFVSGFINGAYDVGLGTVGIAKLVYSYLPRTLFTCEVLNTDKYYNHDKFLSRLKKKKAVKNSELLSQTIALSQELHISCDEAKEIRDQTYAFLQLLGNEDSRSELLKTIKQGLADYGAAIQSSDNKGRYEQGKLVFAVLEFLESRGISQVKNLAMNSKNLIDNVKKVFTSDGDKVVRKLEQSGVVKVTRATQLLDIAKLADKYFSDPVKKATFKSDFKNASEDVLRALNKNNGGVWLLRGVLFSMELE